MKFWNKGKRYRESWYKIEGPGVYQTEIAKHWCQVNGSKDRFYFNSPFWFSPAGTYGPRMQSWTWYFENSEDAVAFKLKWSPRTLSTK